MKKIILFLLFTVATFGIATAQNKWGVVASGELTGIYRLGVERYIPLGHRWYFRTGLSMKYIDMYRRMGHGSSHMAGDEWVPDYYDYSAFDDKALFLEAPLMFKKRMSKESRVNFVAYFDLGFYAACGLCGKTKNYYDTYEIISEYDYLTHNTYEREVINNFSEEGGAFSSMGAYKSRFDMGFNIGFSFLFFKHYQLGLFLDMGLIDLYNDRNHSCCGSGKNWHHGGALSIGYLF